MTEHQAEVKHCQCCDKPVTAGFPRGVIAPVQYGEVIRMLRLALRCRHFYEDKEIPKARITWLTNIYDNIISEGLRYKADVLRFLYNPEVPFTNNNAERDLRMMKCKQNLNVLHSIQGIFSGNIPMPVGN